MNVESQCCDTNDFGQHRERFPEVVEPPDRPSDGLEWLCYINRGLTNRPLNLDS